MFRSDSWAAILHNDHWSTYTSPIAGNVNSTMMVVNIDADEFAKPSGPAKLSELGNEARRMPG